MGITMHVSITAPSRLEPALKSRIIDCAAASADDSLLRFDIPLGLLRSWDTADADTAPPVLHSHDRRAHLAVEGFYLDLRTDSRPDDLKVNSLTLEGILLTK